MILTRAKDSNGPDVADGFLVRIGALADELSANNTLTRCYAHIREPKSAIER